MFAGMMARPAATSARTNSARYELRNRRAPGVAVARPAGALFAAEIFADRDVLHLRGDDAGARIGELRDGTAGARTQRCAPLRELRRRLAPGAEPVVQRLHLAPRVGLDIATRADPCGARARQAALDVDRDARIGIRTGGIVDAERRFPGARVQRDLTHGHPQVGVQPAALVHLARGRKGLGYHGQQLRIHRKAPQRAVEDPTNASAGGLREVRGALASRRHRM